MELERKHKKALALVAYALVAAGVGCLVVPVDTYGIARGLVFGLLMAALVFQAQQIDHTVHAAATQTKQDVRSVGLQLAAVSLIYVVLPAGVVALLHLIVPWLVVLTSGWQMAIGLIWMPLFLASLLQLRNHIK